MRIPQTTFGTVFISLVRFESLLTHVLLSTSHIGFTPRLLLPSEDVTLPGRFNLGLVRIIPSLAHTCFFFFFFISFQTRMRLNILPL